MILSCQLLLNITNTQEAQYTQIVAKPNANILIFYWNPSQGQKTLTHGGSSKVGSASCRFPSAGRGDSPQISLRTRLLTDKPHHPCRPAGGWNLGGQGVPSRESHLLGVCASLQSGYVVYVSPQAIQVPQPRVFFLSVRSAARIAVNATPLESVFLWQLNFRSRA